MKPEPVHEDKKEKQMLQTKTNSENCTLHLCIIVTSLHSQLPHC